MTPQSVVCDTGPILHLHEAGTLDLLSAISFVFIPPRVDDELTRLVENWQLQRPSWLIVRQLQSSTEPKNWSHSGLLHRAEADALALAIQLNADWFLTDDTSARELAKALRVQAHGSLGVLLWGAANRHLAPEQAVDRLENLLRSSLWVSQKIRSEAREALNTILRSSGFER